MIRTNNTKLAVKFGHAFTLLEIVVVVAVIGILAAVVVPKFANAQTEARITATSEDLQGIAKALSMFKATNGTFPLNTSESQLMSDLSPFFKRENPFDKVTPIGGLYNYQAPPSNNPVFLTISNDGTNVFSDSQALILDEYMDNGNLQTGKLKKQNDRLEYYFDGF